MRWKAIIPISIILLILVSVYLFFLDSILKRAFIKTNQFIFGAKVEVDDFKFRFKNFSIDIKGYRAADKDNPMQNIFEIGSVHSSLLVAPLFKKKVVINEASVRNISFNTPRKTSGLLVKKKKKKAKKKKALGLEKTEQIKEKALDFDLRSITKRIDIDEVIKMDSLECVKLSKNIQKEADNKVKAWENKAESLDPTKDINDAKKAVDEIKNIKEIKTLESINEIRIKIQNLERAKINLTSKLKKIKSVKTDFDKDKKYFLGQVKKIDSKNMKKKGYDLINDAVSVKNIDFKNLSKSIFGSSITSKMLFVNKWVTKVRKFMPKKSKEKDSDKEKEKTVKKSRAIDIVFPKIKTDKKEKAYPRFLVKNINISGEGNIQNNDLLKINGGIKALSSSQDIYSEPLVFNIQGNRSGSTVYNIDLNGVFNYIGQNNKEDIKLKISNINLEGFSFGHSNMLPPSFHKGEASVSMNMIFEKDKYTADFDVRLENIVFAERKVNKKDEMQEIIDDIYRNLKIITLKGRVEAQGDDMDINISSNIDEYFSREIKNIVNKKIEQAKAGLYKQFDNRISKIRADLESKLGVTWKEPGKIINSKHDELNNELNIVNSQIEEKKRLINDKVNESKRKALEEKRKLEQEAKKKAQQEINKKKKEAGEKAAEMLKKLW